MGDPIRQAADPAAIDFQLEASPFYWLTRVSGRYLMTMSALLRQIGMDVPRWRVLMILSEHEPASVSVLSEQAVINLSTMTKIVQRMQADDLVAARPQPQDARITEVRLTPHGRAALAQVRVQASAVFHSVFGTIKSDEIARLTATLQTMFANLDKPPVLE